MKKQLIKQIRVKTMEEQTGRRERILNSLPQNTCWRQKRMWLVVEATSKSSVRELGVISSWEKLIKGFFSPHIYKIFATMQKYP